MNTCDIIIPVYNAYDCLNPCIDSVLLHTDMSANRLILINDASPDKRILPLLKEYEGRQNVIVLDNEVNLGFVGTVNRGMKHSAENDVLLLNSDTVVTENWLKKMQECAYSRDEIATVTPLSNNATLASIPKTFEPNDIPEGYDVDSYGKLVERASFNDYPEVPTGHGFCLFIKREALNKVGFFDEESFGKGYGEENDFCFRCLDQGYTHVICDNTFVLHKESQSFAENKVNEIKQGLELLAKRYTYSNHLAVWVSQRKLQYLGINVEIERGIENNRKPNILFVIHDWKDITTNIGGTSLHAWDIIRGLRDRFNFHVLSFNEGAFRVTSYWASSDASTSVNFPSVEKFSLNDFYNHDYARLVGTILDAYHIDAVHIHHLQFQYFDIIDEAKKRKLNVIATLHDFYFMCPRINKLYKYETYCGNCDMKKCGECLKENYATNERGEHFIASWRENCHKELKKCDMLIAPSEAARQEILQTYSDLKIEAIEHGVDIDRVEAKERTGDGKLNIAFLGAIGVHKGSLILNAIAKPSTVYKIHLFGFVDENVHSMRHIANHGRYLRKELPELFKKHSIDLVCLFSIWPETYSYTLTEAIACGVPVIAFDFGAIAERIKKYNLGYVLPIDSTTEDIKACLAEIKRNKAKYNEIVKSINEYKIKTTAEMDSQYGDIYADLCKNASGEAFDATKIRELMKGEIGISSFTVSNDMPIEYGSLKWRIISRIRFPRWIGRLARKIMVHPKFWGLAIK